MEVDSSPSRSRLPPSWTAADTSSDFGTLLEDKNDFNLCKGAATGSSAEAPPQCSTEDCGDIGDDDSSSVDMFMDMEPLPIAAPGPAVYDAVSTGTRFASSLTDFSASSPSSEVAGDSLASNTRTADYVGSNEQSHSSSSDDRVSIAPVRQRSIGKGKRRAHFELESGSSSSLSGTCSAPSFPETSPVLPRPAPRRRTANKGMAERERQGEEGCADDDTTSMGPTARSTADASGGSTQRQDIGNADGNEPPRNLVLGLSQPESPSSSPIVLTNSSSSQSSRLKLSPLELPLGDVTPESSGACMSDVLGRTISRSSTSSSSTRRTSPMSEISSYSPSFSNVSAHDVLDLSTPPKQEVIDIDDSASCPFTCQPTPSAAVVRTGKNGRSVERRQKQSNAYGSGGSSSNTHAGRSLDGTPARRGVSWRHDNAGAKAGCTSACSPAVSLGPPAARRRRRESDPRSPQARARNAATAGSGAATVVEVDVEGGVGEGGVAEGARQRRRRRLAAAAGSVSASATPEAGGGEASTRPRPSSAWAAARPSRGRAGGVEDHVAASSIRRRELREQERRDAEMARMLQLEEQHGGDATAWGEGSAAGSLVEHIGGVAGFAGFNGAGVVGRAGGGWPDVEVSTGRGSGAPMTAGARPGGGRRQLDGSSTARQSSSSSGRGRGRAHRRGGGSAAARQRRQNSSSNSPAPTASGSWMNEIAAIMGYFSQQGMSSNSFLASMMGIGGGGGSTSGGRAGPSASLAALQNRDLTSEDYQQLLALDDRSGGKSAKKGLSQAEVAMLPKQIGNGNGPVDQCCICMEDMTSRQSIIRLPTCLHTFHSKCITKWLKEKSCCPIDKTAVSLTNSG